MSVLFQGKQVATWKESTMSKAFAEVSPSGDRVEVHFRYDRDLHACIKAVPSARYVGPDKGGPMWTIPLNLDSTRKLNEEFGDMLIYGRALRVWIRESRKREENLQVLSSIDSVPATDLKLYTKLPALAKWYRGYQCADVKFMGARAV
jgi:hypothetical protein